MSEFAEILECGIADATPEHLLLAGTSEPVLLSAIGLPRGVDVKAGGTVWLVADDYGELQVIAAFAAGEEGFIRSNFQPNRGPNEIFTNFQPTSPFAPIR